MSDKRSQRAGRSKAVAAEATVATEGDPATSTAPAPAPEAVTDDEAVASPAQDVRRCCDRETVLVTDGIATEPIAYCAKHVPSNLR